MTATERLRQLLDKRGVKWWPMHDVETGYHEDRDTEFLVDGCKHVAHEWGRRLQVDMLTPEQAVEATLGRGTCKVEGSIDYGEFGCWQYDLSCGCRILWPDSEPPTFCPECGRKVES